MQLAADAPYTVTIDVSPPILIANSNATANITATIVASTSLPVSGVVLSRVLNPTALGNVSGLAATDANGRSYGIWTVGSVITSGILSIGNGVATDTARLTATVGSAARLAIENAPAGSGTSIGNTSLSIYDALTAYAAIYDSYENLIGPVSAVWGATGILVNRVSPTTGISTVLTPAPILSGTGVITAAYSTFISTTGLITVLAPQLRISKTASPNPVKPGDVLEYTIVYSNAGSVTAQNVVITESYPAGASYILASPLPTSGNNVWSIGNMVPGGSAAIVVSMRVTDSMPVGSVLTDVVTIGAAKSAAAVYTLTTSVVSAPLLDLAVSDNIDPVRVGESLVYVIQYRNNGNSTATGIRITETYPSQVTFQNAVPAPVLTPTVGSHVWLPSPLAPGGTGSIIVTVRVRSPLTDLTLLNNQVALTSVEQPTPTVVLESTLVQSPIVAVSKKPSVPSPAANAGLTYTLRYTNSGSTYASSAVITDAVPANTAFEDCQPDSCIYNPGTKIVTWNLGDVPSQDAQPVTMTVTVNNNLPAGTLLTNTARIAASENVSMWVSLTNVVTSQPELKLVVSNGVSSAAAGDDLTYALTYSNEGNAPAQGVIITDLLPSHVSFQDCSNSCVSGPGIYTFTLGIVDAGNSGVVTLGLKVDSPLPVGLRAITNTAGIRTSTSGDNVANNRVEDVDQISTVPALDITALFDSSTPFESKTITYNLRYTNTSAMDTTGVKIEVTKSPYVSQASSGWPPTGPLFVGNLAAGTSGTATYSVSLPLTFTQEMVSFVNRFVVSDDGPGGLPIASDMITTVVGVPDLVIENVSLSPRSIVAGTKFTATVTIRNGGTGRACNPNVPPCAGPFYLDAFIDPPVPPPSFPFTQYGITYTIVGPIEPGGIALAVMKNLQFTAGQQPNFYFKIDNYACPGSDCAPSSGKRGLVPENDEYNNVYGPLDVTQHKLYLPLIRKT